MANYKLKCPVVGAKMSMRRLFPKKCTLKKDTTAFSIIFLLRGGFGR